MTFVPPKVLNLKDLNKLYEYKTGLVDWVFTVKNIQEWLVGSLPELINKNNTDYIHLRTGNWSMYSYYDHLWSMWGFSTYFGEHHNLNYIRETQAAADYGFVSKKGMERFRGDIKEQNDYNDEEVETYIREHLTDDFYASEGNVEFGRGDETYYLYMYKKDDVVLAWALLTQSVIEDILQDTTQNVSILYNAPDKDAEYIMDYPSRIFPSIKRGDVIHTGEDDYRNEGKLIFDGEEMMELSEDLDEYGHLPHYFTLNEFPDYHYFDNTIDHNNIRWLNISSEKFIKGIIRVFPKDNTIYDAAFLVETQKGTTYKVLIPPQMSLCNTPSELYEYLANQEWFNEWDQSIPLEIAEAVIGGYDGDVYVIYTPFSRGVYYSDDGYIEPDYENVIPPEGYNIVDTIVSSSWGEHSEDNKKIKIILENKLKQKIIIERTVKDGIVSETIKDPKKSVTIQTPKYFYITPETRIPRWNKT